MTESLRRDRLACAVCNWVLTHVASRWYRDMIRGSILFGLEAATSRGASVSAEGGEPQVDTDNGGSRPCVLDREAWLVWGREHLSYEEFCRMSWALAGDAGAAAKRRADSTVTRGGDRSRVADSAAGSHHDDECNGPRDCVGTERGCRHCR